MHFYLIFTLTVFLSVSCVKVKDKSDTPAAPPAVSVEGGADQEKETADKADTTSSTSDTSLPPLVDVPTTVDSTNCKAIESLSAKMGVVDLKVKPITLLISDLSVKTESCEVAITIDTPPNYSLRLSFPSDVPIKGIAKLNVSGSSAIVYTLAKVKGVAEGIEYNYSLKASEDFDTKLTTVSPVKTMELPCSNTRSLHTINTQYRTTLRKLSAGADVSLKIDPLDFKFSYTFSPCSL